MDVAGAAYSNGMDLWKRSSGEQRLPLSYVPDQPILLPASGADNMSCYQGGAVLQRGRKYLEQMVFAHDLVDSICNCPDARHCPRCSVVRPCPAAMRIPSPNKAWNSCSNIPKAIASCT